MSVGLIALLDDVAGIAKVAAASIDDVMGHAARAGAKSAGVVIDDAAVTPRYVVGFAAEREIPIVRRIAVGSLRNKLLILLPAALLLSALAPWAITPLLMLGGAFLCYEGAEKVWELVSPHAAHDHEAKIGAAPRDAVALENAKVSGAIRTDLILSAEIMAIALAALPAAAFWTRAISLALVGVGITALVYGAVALIVKADDFGLRLARAEGDAMGARASRALGVGLIRVMPHFLKALSLIGTAAMIWVGGGILVHGLAVLGFHGPEHAVDALARSFAAGGQGLAGWFGHALGAGALGLAVGFALIPLVSKVIAPAWKAARG